MFNININMKSIALIFFVLGIVFIVSGYTELEMNEKETTKIEYRFVPRSVYDEVGLVEITDKVGDMFSGEDVLFDRRKYPTNLV